jgi:hypothetical protein
MDKDVDGRDKHGHDVSGRWTGGARRDRSSFAGRLGTNAPPGRRVRFA